MVYVEQAFGVPLVVKWFFFVRFAQEIEDANFMFEVTDVFIQRRSLVACQDH